MGVSLHCSPLHVHRAHINRQSTTYSGMELRNTTLAQGVESRRAALAKGKQKVHIKWCAQCAARRRRLAPSFASTHSHVRLTSGRSLCVPHHAPPPTRWRRLLGGRLVAMPRRREHAGHALLRTTRPTTVIALLRLHAVLRNPRRSTSATSTSARPRTSTARARSKDLVVSSRRTHTFSPRSRTKAGRTTSDRT